MCVVKKRTAFLYNNPEYFLINSFLCKFNDLKRVKFADEKSTDQTKQK